MGVSVFRSLLPAVMLATLEGHLQVDVVEAGTSSRPAHHETEPRWSLEVTLAPTRVAAEARVREFDVRGSFLDLDDGMGLDNPGYFVAAKVGRRLGRWRILFLGSVARSSGNGSSGAGFAFNGGLYPADRSIRTTLITTRLRLEGAWRCAGTPTDERLLFLAGLEHYHPVLSIDADPLVPTHDRKEDYLQFLPLPVLGFEASNPMGRQWVLRSRISAGTAPDWPTGRSEGGPMRMGLTLAQFETTLSHPLGGRASVSVGYRFEYAQGRLESSEDTNWIRSREHAIVSGVTLRR